MTCPDGTCTDHNMNATGVPTGADDPCNSSGEGVFCNGAYWYYAGDGSPCSEQLFIRTGDTCNVNQWLEIPLACNSFVDAQLNVAQAVAPSTFTKVQFNNEIADILGDYDNAVSTFTAPRNGVYSVCNYMQYAAEDWVETDATAFNSIYINGVFSDRLVVGTYYSPPDLQGHFRAAGSGCKNVQLAGGDTVEIYNLHSDSVAHTLLDVAGTNWLNIALVLAT